MNKIFIEAGHKGTTEYNFIQTILVKYFQRKEYEIVTMGCAENLFNETNMNIISKANTKNVQVLVLVDADTVKKGWGYNKRKEWIEKGISKYKVSFQYFIYPNNQGDGDVEVLMESSARKDLHEYFFNCFNKYKECIVKRKDEREQSIYNSPDLKTELHAYIKAQTEYDVKNKIRKPLDINNGNYLFDNTDYWNLDVENLQPLKDFFSQYLK